MFQTIQSSKSLRTFIGAKDFNVSKAFYLELNFKEFLISPKLSYFNFNVNENIGFYLQDYYVKNWVNNTMLFLEVGNITEAYETIKDLDLESKFNKVRLHPIKQEDWGQVFFLHDPSGVLWQIGSFTP